MRNVKGALAKYHKRKVEALKTGTCMDCQEQSDSGHLCSKCRSHRLEMRAEHSKWMKDKGVLSPYSPMMAWDLDPYTRNRRIK